MLALFAVLGALHPRTIKPFLPSFLSQCHSREKRYQVLSRFTVLIVTESWAGPENEVVSIHAPNKEYAPNKDVIIKPRPTCIACSKYATWTWTAIDLSVLYKVKMSSAAATSGLRWQILTWNLKTPSF